MKFAKQLEDNLVPEWRVKYIDYKGAKKKLKAVRRAIRDAEAASTNSNIGGNTPASGPISNITNRFRAGSISESAVSSLQNHITPKLGGYSPQNETSSPTASSTIGSGRFQRQDLVRIGEEDDEDSSARRISGARRGALSIDDDDQFAKTQNGKQIEPERRYLNPSPRPGESPQYGATSTTPKTPIRTPKNPLRRINSSGEAGKSKLPSILDLPEPAKPLDERNSLHLHRSHTYDSALGANNNTSKDDRTPRFAVLGSGEIVGAELGRPTARQGDALQSHSMGAPSSHRSHSRPLFKHMFSTLRHRISHHGRPSDPNLRNANLYLEMTEDAQKEFFSFLTDELKKIDDFYQARELEAKERLIRIEHQISLMNENRLLEKESQLKIEEEELRHGFDWKHPKGIVNDFLYKKRLNGQSNGGLDENGSSENLTKPKPTIARLTAAAVDAAAGPAQPKSRLQAFQSLNDYSRKKEIQHVRYKSAKRKIKAALIQYYHSLELLKSYCLLNREGFRKILKKYDKTAHARISNKYLNEKINTAAFASSDDVDQLITNTEGIFATHFEKGRRKHAIERLRTREHRKPATAAMFRSGIYIGAMIPLMIQALFEAWHRLEDGFGMRHESQTSYLLQIWAGFGFPILFMMLFSICCKVWTEARINYVFIFEFDTRSNLDWRQLLELPSLFAFILSVFMWFSFAEFWGTGFDRIWFPLIFLAVLLVIILNPFHFDYFESRRWLLYTLFRLIWAGYYPVEFRDFWTGDILCSLTYTLGNIPLFFCLWSRDWNNPDKCNSSNSRLLGFFTCIPSIIRLLQCFRRYNDTKNAFPHLANGAKYTCGILYYMSLSLFRMDRGSVHIKGLFIACAAINAIYTSTWDLLMDWSLLNWYAPKKLLRHEMAFRKPWTYYAAMIIDPIIRNAWIFYIILPNELQHSKMLSFAVSLAELLRRFIWCFFRMENEHCTNVNKFRAYKEDVPLPYDVPCPGLSSRAESIISPETPDQSSFPQDLPTDIEQPSIANTATPAMIPNTPNAATASKRPMTSNADTHPSRQTERTPILRAFTYATTAHAQDFERKKPAAKAIDDAAGKGTGLRKVLTGTTTDGEDDYDEEDSDEEEAKDREREIYGSVADDMIDELAGLRRRRGSSFGGAGTVGGTTPRVGESSGRLTRGTGALLSPALSPNRGRNGGNGIEEELGESSRRAMERIPGDDADYIRRYDGGLQGLKDR